MKPLGSNGSNRYHDSIEPQDPIGEGQQNQSVNGSINGSYPDLDPIFSYKSSDFNLKYKNLLPFLAVYLFYRWCK